MLLLVTGRQMAIAHRPNGACAKDLGRVQRLRWPSHQSHRTNTPYLRLPSAGLITYRPSNQGLSTHVGTMQLDGIPPLSPMH